MSAFEKLTDIYATAVRWEEELSDLYDVAEIGLKRPKSNQLIRELHREHDEKLRVLEGVKLDDFGPAEWVKYPPQAGGDEMVPAHGMTKDADPVRVLQLVLDFQKRQEAFYQALHDRVVSPSHKELLESLVTFKRNQAEGIQRLMEEYATEE